MQFHLLGNTQLKSRTFQLKALTTAYNCVWASTTLYVSNENLSNPHLSSPFCCWGSADTRWHMSIGGCRWCSNTSARSLHCPSHTHFLSHNLNTIIMDNSYVKIRLCTSNTCTYVYKLQLHFSIMHNYNWDFTISIVFSVEQDQRSAVVYRVLYLWICVWGWGREGVATSQPNAPGSFLKIVKAGASLWSIRNVSTLFVKLVLENYPSTAWTTWEILFTSLHRWEAVSYAEEYSIKWVSFMLKLHCTPTPVHSTSLRVLRSRLV